MINFTYGSKLADLQERCIKNIMLNCSVANNIIQDLIDNIWVKLAAILAPSNLVIRQWCLIDILTGIPSHSDKIRSMVERLSYWNNHGAKNSLKIWAEGYSYYEYTLDALLIWKNKFWNDKNIEQLERIISAIENGFVNTSYLRNGLRYPAPFGDLRDIPLAGRLQNSNKQSTVSIVGESFVLTFDYLACREYYSVLAQPIGFNTHIPKDPYQISIMDGKPVDFKFYEGYNKKYKNFFEEIIDTFSLKRFLFIL